MSLTTLSITEAAEKLRTKEISARELTESHLKAIEEHNPALNAYLETFDDALVQADAADKRLSAGERESLLGIPLAIKDNILIEGRTVTAGSKILEGYRASFDATAIKKLKERGAVFLGRTNMDEFAMGSSTEHSAFGLTKNPLDPTRVPGGSSGGSAAAVAAGLAMGALGSDTGGSIREPASFCGLVGMKPTYGAISRSGLIAMGSSLDQIGPLTRTVEDAKILFEAMRGHDPLDSTSLPDGFFPTDTPMQKRIGVPEELLEGLHSDVRQSFDASLERYRAAGYSIQKVALPSVRYGLAAYYIVMPAEASTNLSRFDGVRYGLHKDGADLLGDYLETRGEGFGAEVRRRIILGTYVLSAGYYDAFYNKATALRQAMSAEFEAAFTTVDFIATPTAPTTAFKIGEKSDPVSMYLADIFTVPANLTGLPAISLPAGAVKTDTVAMPVGLQLTAPWGREDWLFTAGALLH